MILGRASELKYLNTYYERRGSQILVVYGQRNVGKTTLLLQFAKERPSYYYLVRSASDREQRYRWGRELEEKMNASLPEYPAYQEILTHLKAGVGEKKVIIIDEFQLAVKAGEGFMKALVEFVHNTQEGQVMIILCSSSIGFVENSMITRMGEAAYELSGFLKIRELEFEVMREYFPDFSKEQCVEAYAVLGGLPGLWSSFDDKLSIRDNLCRTLLDKKSLLCTMGQQIVEEELRETGVYDTLLASIAAGNHKLNELYLHTGFSRAKISVYLKNLMELELVEKVFSYDTEGRENAKKGIYRISSHLVHFYFAYLYPHLSRLEELTPGAFYQSYIAPDYRNFVAEYFKVVCRQYMEKWNRWGRLPIKTDRFGEWVGKLGNIDIIAQDEQQRSLIGLCSFDRPIMRYDDYEWLLFCAEKAKLSADHVYLFSVKNFDEKLTLEAKVRQNLKLISLDEM